MSWMAKLYATYEAGIRLDLDGEEPLMPISHSIQNAHIHLTLNEAGQLLRAEAVEKMAVMLPATEKSAGRTSNEAPHALADKLQYVAADYLAFGGIKKSYYAGYQQQLRGWCQSPFNHPKAEAVLRYIEKGRVIADLVDQGVVFLDEAGKLLQRWSGDDVPRLFKSLPKQSGITDQGAALVCWSVEISREPESRSWVDPDLQQSWVDYQASQGSDTGLCYITGQQLPLATSHPAKLRHSGDGAKLVSANDERGFTFRGRFHHSNESAAIGFDVTQKAHNALRWLINRQGFRNGEQVWVCWAVSGKPIPEVTVSSLEWHLDDLAIQEPTPPESNHNQPPAILHSRNLGAQFAHQLNRYLAGYRAKLHPTDEIVILGLDSATPGRMSIIYYREFLAEAFLNRLHDWHLHFSWYQRHTQTQPVEGRKKAKKVTIWPVASPAPKKIAETIYGSRLDEALKKKVIERIMPCLIDRRPLPEDLMRLAVKRVSNRVGYPSDEWWRWEQDLGITCALYRGYCYRHPNPNQQKEFSMALEEDNHTRDYLYGRLLALAERIEEVALSISGENRTTMAARLMQRFANHPYTTWRTLELSLQPYMQRLQVSRTGFLVIQKRELDQILSCFTSADFSSDKPLRGEFLLGYHCQRLALRNKKADPDQTTESTQIS
ncbi:MAG: type I-C CRISPR-associated protein Cas8c/Csd1 [Magnetococcales bacterium]|nr:type I-C CRISPR-associated protein Cas8c/Csd1 [Magnetococcales bacterium]